MSGATEAITKIRQKMGDRLAILGHHYQSDAVMQHADISGDSLELARKIATLDAEHIVFCGVYFMAESAAILRRGNQKIHIPDTTASCPMADMALAGHVNRALTLLSEGGRSIVPLTYVNSSAAVKAVVGRWNGSVCTSANAQKMMRWALDKGDAVLFLPDRHLGWNTAEALDIPENERLVLGKKLIDGDPEQALDRDTAASARVLLWPGFCPIHEEFTMSAINEIRKNTPEAMVVVHPECPPAVTAAADANGSTSFIIKYVAEAPQGATIHIGTEANLVHRLRAQYRGKKDIVPLKTSYCEDMGKTTEENLATLLESIETVEPVDVSDAIRQPSRAALETMLTVCA